MFEGIEGIRQVQPAPDFSLDFGAERTIRRP
jgi:hypothetical protein